MATTQAGSDPITIKEAREQIVSMQKRGLTVEGAIKAVTKALTGRVVLMEDGTEVAAGDIEFAAPAEQAEMDGEEEEVKAEEGEEDEEEAAKSKKTVVKLAQRKLEEDAEKKQKGKRPNAPVEQKLIIPATVKRHKPRHFVGKRHDLEADHRAYLFGQWALAAISKGCPNMQFPNAVKFCEERSLLQQKLHQTNVNTTGGYLVPEEFGTDLIDLREQFGVARRLLKVRPMASDTRTDPRRVSGLSAYFVSEGGAGTESTKGWDQVRLTAKDLMVLSRMTNQLSEDAVMSIGDDLAGEISYAFSEKEDRCAFNGDGTSTFGGIVGIRSQLATGTKAGLVDSTTSNTWDAIVLADFESVVGKLPQYADTPNAVWVCHRAFYYTVMLKLVLAAGGATAQETATGDRRPRPIFMGYPVEFSQVFPSSTAASTVSAVLGDISLGASFGDRQQDTIAFSEHATIGGESVFERNEIAIRGTERFDVNVHDVGDDSNAGPIVGLTTGS